MFTAKRHSVNSEVGARSRGCVLSFLCLRNRVPFELLIRCKPAFNHIRLSLDGIYIRQRAQPLSKIPEHRKRNHGPFAGHSSVFICQSAVR